MYGNTFLGQMNIFALLKERLGTRGSSSHRDRFLPKTYTSSRTHPPPRSLSLVSPFIALKSIECTYSCVRLETACCVWNNKCAPCKSERVLPNHEHGDSGMFMCFRSEHTDCATIIIRCLTFQQVFRENIELFLFSLQDKLVPELRWCFSAF